MKQSNLNYIENLEKIDINKIRLMNPKQFQDHLVNELGLFEREEDFKLFVLESLQEAIGDTTEWPIRYYKDDEELCEDNQEYLTDEYIQNNLKCSVEPKE